MRNERVGSEIRNPRASSGEVRAVRNPYNFPRRRVVEKAVLVLVALLSLATGLQAAPRDPSGLAIILVGRGARDTPMETAVLNGIKRRMASVGYHQKVAYYTMHEVPQRNLLKSLGIAPASLPLVGVFKLLHGVPIALLRSYPFGPEHDPVQQITEAYLSEVGWHASVGLTPARPVPILTPMPGVSNSHADNRDGSPSSAPNSTPSPANGALQFGQGKVYYCDGATEQDARTIGGFLQQNNYFTHRTWVRIRRSGDTYLLDFILKQGKWNEPSTCNLFNLIGVYIACNLLHGKPTTIHLCDDTLATQKRIPIMLTRKTDFGNNCDLYSSSDIPDDLAREVISAFSAQFKGTIDVTLTRPKYWWVIGFVVKKGKWNDDDVRKVFVKYAREIDKMVFHDQPMDVQLLDEFFQPHFTRPI